jgi:predicted nucleic acid-binding protein
VIVDTSVVLDVLLARKPFVGPAAEVFGLAERSEIEAYLCATTMTTLDYLLSQSLPRIGVRDTLDSLLALFEIAPVNRPVIEEALKSKVTDFEDAVLEQSGRLVGAEAIVSRDVKGFRHSTLTAFDPVELLIHLKP